MSGTADQQMEMPCLGRPFQLGTLYDFRNDSLIPGVTLWGPETLGTATCTKMEGSNFEVITEDSFNEKALHLDVNAGLKLSVLGGLVKAGGSGKFLYDRTTSKNQARVSLKYRATSRFEQLNMSQLGKFEYPRVFDDDIATHVVTGVLYGADAIFVFDRQVESSEKLKKVHGEMEANISALPSMFFKVEGKADLDLQKTGKTEMENCQCKFYGDFILPSNPTTYQDAVRVYQELPKLLGGAGYPNSFPKKVWLYPLSKLDSKVQRMVREISSILIDDLQDLMESLHELEVRNNDLIRNEVCIYFAKIKGDLEKLKRLIGSYKVAMLKKMATLLPQVRGGGAKEAELAELFEENTKSPFSSEQLSFWVSSKEREVGILSVYLEELKQNQIQLKFSSSEMVNLTCGFDEDAILCFDFNIPMGNDSRLQRMEAYLHGRTVSKEPQVQKYWYKTQIMRQAFQRFVNFVKVNASRQGFKYVAANGDIIESDKVGLMVVYEDGCLTEFEPPDQPGKPCTSKTTHNSVQLKWAKPKHGAQYVQSYTVTYQAADDSPDQWCTQASDAECLELTNLTPGSLYCLKVTAETSVGSSPTSEVSEPIQLPPDQPGKPHASEKNYKFVQLKWSKPKHGADIVQCYTVLYQSTDAQWCKKTTKEEFLVLTNLTPGSLYSFKVVAESSAGSSPSSEAIEVQLPPDQPGKPLATEVTHNSVQLKWDKPKHGSKIVKGYKFFYRLADNPPREWLIQEADKECLYLKKLTPGFLYCFKVTAESSAGSSPGSTVNEVWLPPDQPGKPEIKGMTHNSLQLKWSKPKHGEQIVQSYTLSYCCVDNLLYQWCTHTCSEEYTMLTKLIPGSVYRFKVFTNSHAGPGPASEVSEVMLPPDQPGKPVASDATYNSVCLKWTKPKHGAETVQSYSISYQAVDNQCHNINTTSNHEHVTVTNLTPKTVYTFKVRAESAAGHGPDSELSDPVETALPPPGKPHASNVTHNSLQLNWEKPSHGTDSVLFYTVSYCTGNYSQNQWNTKRTPVAVESIQLVNLLPKTVYYFKVRADSAAGPSPDSELSNSIETNLLPISKPGKPTATRVTQNSVTLEWDNPEQSADIVKCYTIFYRCSVDDLDADSSWHTHNTFNPVATAQLTNLVPQTAYVFKVRAESTAGASPDSEISDPIETLLPISQPGKPRNSKVSHNSITLEWDKPERGADVVKHYTVLYRRCVDYVDVWNTFKTPNQKVSTIAINLDPKMFYIFKVKAESASGSSTESECSDPIETLSPISQPGKPYASNITHNSITLQWSKSDRGSEIVQYYTIFYRRSADDTGKWTAFQTFNAQQNATLPNLDPKTAYVFKLRAESAASGSSPDSELSDPIDTLLPISQPGKPFATKVTHDSVTLKWERPKQGAQYLKHYQVIYYSTDDSGNIVSRTAREEKITLLHLDPNSAYIFKVKAETVTGSISESEFSDPIKTRMSPPGKPYATNITYKGFDVNWQRPSYGPVLYYNVSYQATSDPPDKWHTKTTVGDIKHFQFSAAKGNFYVFKVAAVTSAGVSSESELSDPIETKAEPWGAKIYKSLDPIPNSNPPTYLLPTHCVLKKKDIVKVHVGANSHGKIKSDVHTSCSCHIRTAGVRHKVFMVVGATGAGKTTLINGMANYIMGVQWDDDLRFKLIAESTSQDQSKSQTMCITAYTFYKGPGSNLPYTLTVIDTPGFGDTGGLTRDKYIVSQIKELFSISGDEGIDELHGIGFVTQAPLARLTPTQQHVFDTILSVFGKDVVDNIFLMITFADGMKPPVLDAVKAADVPNKAFFKFNNSALFASKSADDEFDKMFWKMGTKSFDEFFQRFSNALAQSLQLSREVIQERETLEVTIQGLQLQIKLGLSKIDELRQMRQMLKDHEAQILNNRDFTYTCEVTKQRKIDLPLGTYTTNCLTCNYTCHDNCPYSNDDYKYMCTAMSEGRGTRNAFCGVCPQKCSWRMHRNNSYRLELYKEYQTRTIDEIKTRYESAMSSKEQLECVIKKLKKELDTLNVAVLRKMEQARRSVQRLQGIALKPYYLTEVEYIDLIIETEKREAKPRWLERVKALEGVRQQAEIVTELMKNPPQGQQQYVFSIEDTVQEKSMWQKFLHKFSW